MTEPWQIQCDETEFLLRKKVCPANLLLAFFLLPFYLVVVAFFLFATVAAAMELDGAHPNKFSVVAVIGLIFLGGILVFLGFFFHNWFREGLAWERRLQQSDRRAEAFHALMEEARTPEEMEALAEMAYGDEEEDIFEEEDEGDFLDEGYTRDQYEADEEVRQICSSIQELCKILIKNRYDEMIGLPEQGEFLSLMVKSQTAADMTAGENSGFERGFLIAHVKREIARSQHIISGLRAFSEEKEQQLVEEIWKLRDLLIQLAGKLRA